VGDDGAIDQYRARMTDASWVDVVLIVCTKLLELESTTEDAEVGLIAD
jgi:hypothetical protein